AVTAILIAVLPGLRSGAVDLMRRLRNAGSTGAELPERRLRYGLVSLQFALAVTLLLCTGLLIQSFRRIASVPLGFDAKGLALYHTVSAEFLAATRVPLIEGRWFTADDMRAANGFVINQALARTLAPSGSALGKRITVRRSSQARADFGAPITLPVIGVVGDM